MIKNKYTIDGDTAIVEVKYKDQVFIMYMDAADLNKVGRRTITAQVIRDKEGTIRNVYFRVKVGKKDYRLHRFLMDTPDDMTCDHIDRNTFNNRRSNLRNVTIGENCQNKGVQRNNSTGVRGVTYKPKCVHNPWEARVRIDQKTVFLKYFPTKEEAEQAVIEARKKHMPFSID